jgi:hypothetical protein
MRGMEKCPATQNHLKGVDLTESGKKTEKTISTDVLIAYIPIFISL